MHFSLSMLDLEIAWARSKRASPLSFPPSFSPSFYTSLAKLTKNNSLAYAEMRLILARVVFNFDMRIADESRNWIDQRVYNLWKKGPLSVYLTPVRR